MIQTAYGLNGLYNEGFDGTGQTIGIMDWCGSLTIQDDANAFSAHFGLPPLTSSNFAITYIPTPSLCESADQVEINIDVEWAHAIAPGANINLIVPPSASFQDVNEAEFTAINYGLANVLSGSYGSSEAFTPGMLENENLINEIGAIAGISTNFSSGDDGDFTYFGIPSATVSAPADSPWATAVGGVALALNPDNSIKWQDGWGNNQTLLAETGTVFDPPLAFGFIGGAGGGPSNCATDFNFNCLAGFPKPSYQKRTARQIPSASRRFLAGGSVHWCRHSDHHSGSASRAGVAGVGRHKPGLPDVLRTVGDRQSGSRRASRPRAPYLYSLPPGAVTDIVPVTASHNVVADIKNDNGTTHYNANQVLGGTSPGKFVSALWDYPSEQSTALAISFGTDCTAVPNTFGEIRCNSTRHPP